MKKARDKATWVALAAVAAALLAPTAALAGGSGIALRSNVSKGDTSVGASVQLSGFPNELCAATIGKGGRKASAGSVRTSENGGAIWSWQIPGNVSAGPWKFSVRCAGGRHLHRAHTSFHADHGAGRRSAGLWIPHTLHRKAVILPSSDEGNGGGEGLLYPVGQCTWWVAIHREDLPTFHGRSGDAMNWAKSARAHGFPVGSAPRVGAVAVFQPGQYGAGRFGHVALVIGVKGRKIKISEAGLRGPGIKDVRTIRSKGLRFIYKKGNPAPGLTAFLTAPADGAHVQGTVNVTAASNAPAIRFAVYSFADPAAPDSAGWQAIGEDTTRDDGFSTAWDTTSIPNQGGSGSAAVVVEAIVLGRDGTPTGASSYVKVAVANSRTAGGQTYFPYYVVGTCSEGECGLPVRSGPGFSKYGTKGEKQDGDEVDLVCQGYGETYVSPLGGSSSIWDRLTDGGWVTDYYVDTPEPGAFSPPIPQCP